MTNSSTCDLIRDLSEEGFVLLRILASYKNFECDLSAFQRLQMLRFGVLDLLPFGASFAEENIPFFAVVTM